MDQPIIKQIIKLVAIRMSAIRGASISTATEPLLYYFRLLHRDVSKSTIESIVTDCFHSLEEPGMTVERLRDKALHEIRGSLEHKDQLQMFIMLLDFANQSESLENIMQPLSLADAFGIMQEDAGRFRLFMTGQDPAARRL